MTARRLALAAMAAALCAPTVHAQVDPNFHGKGFQPNRELASELPFEHVDPLNGNLLLNLPMLGLPGNAGFDLAIRPVYNIKIYDSYLQTSYLVGENGPAGLGFTLHFGRVLNFNSVTPGPVIEMPDGSSHPSFLHRDGNPAHYMTRDFWTYQKNSPTSSIPVLRLPNGVRYTFGENTTLDGPLYATEIRDRFGNRLRINYVQGSPGLVASVNQDLATGPVSYQTRTVTFDYVTISGKKALRTITSDLGTWTFVQEATPQGYVVLRELQPPPGTTPSWKFDYYPSNHPDAPFLLQRLETPNGGVITYEYQRQLFYSGSQATYAPVLRRRTTSGFDIAGGSWLYTFDSPGPFAPITATVDAPCRRTVYVTNPIINQPGDQTWFIGTLASRTIQPAGGGTALEVASYTWKRSIAISNNATGGPTYAALLERQTIVRDGLTLVTTNTYDDTEYSSSRSRNFHDYGQPIQVHEQGSVVRDTDLAYLYPPGGDPGFGTYLVGLLQTESVRVGTETFTKTFGYVNGFMTSESIYGVTRTFTPTPGGNVASVKDASNHVSSYEYSWGVPSVIQTPGYRITRVVNRSGTIQSERRRNFTTSFTYDGLARLRSTTFPTGNPASVDYSTDGHLMTHTRGPSFVRTTLDGFGRPSATINAVGVRTDTNYDTCGRTVLSSYPFLTQIQATTFGYDALDRLTSRANPDASDATFTYSPGTATLRKITILDELDRPTTQLWQTFGNPDDARLFSVEDAGSGAGGARQTTSYQYNAVGSLTRVDAPAGGPRTWTYNTKNQLVNEKHPESDAVVYTYLADGIPYDRTDASGRTIFSHDANHRLVGIDRPGTAPDTAIQYDESDNRTLLTRGAQVVSRLRNYDGNNRLGEREDTISGRKLTTRYTYDGNDNVGTITYPSAARAVYTYDSESRITSVADGPAPGDLKYADAITWHPSGGLLSYTAGNGTVHNVDYDPQRYWIAGARSRWNTTTLTSSTYGHDFVGNVTSLQEPWLGASAVSLTYDGVDRLKTLGPSGAPFRSDYTYDSLGNRRERRIGGALTTFTYDGTSNRLTQMAQGATVTNFEYDGNGNTLRLVPPAPAPPETYTYDPDNMLATSSVGGVAASYLYDGDQLRKQKTSGGQTTFYVHGPGNQVLGEYRANGSGVAPNREYVYAGARPIASVKPAFLTVTPELVAFAEVVGTPATSGPRTVTVSAGGATANWQAQPNASWIGVSPTSGTTPATLSVTVNHAGLGIGLHTGTITVTSPNALGSPRTVTVLLAVASEPGLVVLPRPMRFEATEGDTSTVPQTMYVMRAGSTTPVAWNATVSPTAPWLTLSATSGNTPATVEVRVDPTGRRRGAYHGFITVTAPLTGSPKVVPVDLIVRPGPGTLCDPASWYCERFDGMSLGPIDGQNGWSAIGGEVALDSRGAGNALLLDAPSVGDGTINGFVNVVEHPIDGNQISMQIMVRDVPVEARQVAKVEFQTQPGVAWGKTSRTYGALRFGSKLYLQYGPNIWKVLMDQLEAERWYDVRVVYSNSSIFAYVDGVQRAVLKNPLSGTYPTQTFVFTGWDFPGQGYVDLLEARGAESGLVVDPQPVRFSTPSGIGTPGPAPKSNVPSGAARSFSSLLPAFEANRGQAPADVRFLARGRGHGVLLTDDAVVLTAPSGSRGEPVRVRFEGAHARSVAAVETLPGTVNYLRGNDPSRWITGVTRHSRVRYAQIYPGIDLDVYLRDREIEYDLVVAPGADPDQVKLAFEGANSVRLDEGGDVVLETAWGSVRQRRPVAYQSDGEGRTPVAGRYRLSGTGATFAMSDYDPTRSLLIDPVLVYSTFLGGATTTGDDGQDSLTSVEVDADGTLYLAGTTLSLTFATNEPIRIGAPFNPENPSDVFVAKLNPTGTALQFLTFVSGSAYDGASDLAIDQAGRITVTGFTYSSDFPTAPAGGAYDSTYGGSGDAFVFRLNASGSALEYSTYLGGSAFDGAASIDITQTGEAIVAGSTISADFPVRRPLPDGGVLHGTETWDVFVTWFMATGTALRHSTYLGGLGDDSPASLDILLSPKGTQVFVAGATSSTDFPTTPGVVRPAAGANGDGFLTRIDSNGLGGPLASIRYGYSTYVRPFENLDSDRVTAIVVDPNGTVHLTLPRHLYELGYPTNHVMGVAPDGSQFVYDRELGAGGVLNGIALHQDSSLSVVGRSTHICPDPSERPCLPYVQPLYNQMEGEAAYVARLDPMAGSVRFGTDIGCPFDVAVGNYTTALAVTALEGTTYVVGETSCIDDFLLANALQPYQAGVIDGFVTAIADDSMQQDTIEFTSVSYRTIESGDTPGSPVPQAVITLRRTGTLQASAAVTLKTYDGTAIAGQDYQALDRTVLFGAGDAEATAYVTLIDDSVAEQTETLNLWLSNPVNATLGTITYATLTIDDDDGLTRFIDIRDRVLATGPTWTIAASIPWLDFDAKSGVGPSRVRATANPGTRPPGTYNDFFVVTGDTGDSPQVIEAILVVRP